MMVSSGDEWNHLLVIKRGWLENLRNGRNAWSLLTTHQQSSRLVKVDIANNNIRQYYILLYSNPILYQEYE
jgi:hypothetical protein